MNNQKQLSKIEKSIEKGSLCAINREIIDTFSIYGYPVSMTGELAVVQFVYDFMLDGYKFIRKSDITHVMSGEEESFLDKVIKKEYPENKLAAPDFKADTMQNLCKELAQKGKIVTVECEDFEENIVLIGKISSVENGKVNMKTFDGVGVWEKEMFSIALDDITCITIGNRYVSVISKYLKD